ncbi:hypothetical protein CYMTET_44939 [Cymbomonas tetramitiformis]|uniref:Uncharacterized protein n=2 Tax=Cymbomonas tetramitiformis TaxID=36881 RepID=A0AAE0BZ78_9CHLO|nr:hypothetical protein CYMTET_44939 [Cymbomonas tetramitiformis]
MLTTSAARPGFDPEYIFYDKAPERKEEVMQLSGARKVVPDLFHDSKLIISKMNNSNKRFKWASTRVRLAFQHRSRGEELKVDAALMAGKLSTGRWQLFGQKWPVGYKFTADEIASFKELKYDPINGRLLKAGLYWETFDESIIHPSMWSSGITLSASLESMGDELIRLERAEGAGPGTRRGSLFSPGALFSINKAIRRASMYDELVESSYPQHLRLPAQFAFGILAKWRVNGRGSLSNERVHALWKTLVTRNMSTIMGVLLLLEGSCMYNGSIREALQTSYGALTYDWWQSARCNELALELHGEQRYELSLPPVDDGESFLVPGLLDFVRPSVKKANEKMAERAAACIASASTSAERQKRLKGNAECMRQLRAARAAASAGESPPLPYNPTWP